MVFSPITLKCRIYAVISGEICMLMSLNQKTLQQIGQLEKKNNYLNFQFVKIVFMRLHVF